jgi:hypothetical protein
MSDRYLTNTNGAASACETCGAGGEVFGYHADGAWRWFCEEHRKGDYADKRATVPVAIEPTDADITLPRRELTFKPVARKVECAACGAEADAVFHPTCGCNAGFRSKRQRAAEAIKADPSKSNRMIAEEIDADEKTVRHAREQVRTPAAPEQITGRDGKNYPATRARPYRPEPSFTADQSLLDQARANLDNIRSLMRLMTVGTRDNFRQEVIDTMTEPLK